MVHVGFGKIILYNIDVISIMGMERKFRILDGEGNLSEVRKLEDCMSDFNDGKTSAVVETDGNGNIIRYIMTDADFEVEPCPHCGKESLVKSEFRVQHCTECGELILPCNMCVMDFCDCKNCPLKRL